MTRKTVRRLIWGLLGIVALIMAKAGHDMPHFTEVFYGQYIYPNIRWFYKYTLGLLPFSGLWVVVVILCIHGWRTAIVPLRRGAWHWRTFVGGLISTAGAFVFFFYLLWGFNYGRDDMASRLDLDIRSMGTHALQDEFAVATAELTNWTVRHQAAIEPALNAISDEVEPYIRRQLTQVLGRMDFPLSPDPRGRLLKPRGLLLRFNTAGIYIPYSGEGHVDAGIHPIQIPFTMAHELAHGYGVTDEGDCNFLAYLTCAQSDDPLVRYSGLLSYWRYVASEMRRAMPDQFQAAYDTLHPLITHTLVEIRENNDKYPEIFPKMRDVVYESYLQSHGVEEGLRSYSRVVRLVRAYRESIDHPGDE